MSATSRNYLALKKAANMSMFSASSATSYVVANTTTATVAINGASFAGFGGTGTSGGYINKITITNGSLNINGHGTYLSASDLGSDVAVVEKEIIPKKVGLGTAFDMEMPDGSILKVAEDGNFEIDDKDAKVTYKSNTQRGFNRYINASDLLVEFIDDLRKLGVPQDRVLSVPIEVFINWLMVRSAEADGEPPSPDVPKLETRQELRAPRCGCCGRYIPYQHEKLGLRFCNGTHADRALAKVAACPSSN